MSVFGRLNYNFDSDKFGAAQYLPEETLKSLSIGTSNDLYTWQKEKLSEGNPIIITDYRQNPLANLCNSILSQVESIITVTEQPPADWSSWVSGTLNPSLLLTAAESARDEIKLFTDHTCNISGVPSIHVSNEYPDPNVPSYDSAISYGRQVLNIVYQTDEVANAIPILGSFTSLYIKTDIENANTGLNTSYVNSFISNPSGTDTGVVTGITSNLNSLITLIQTRRLHDWQFFSNTKIILNDYLKLKRLGMAGKSNTEFSLVNDLVGTDMYKDAIDSQIVEAAEIEYNREYVGRPGYGNPPQPKPPGVDGADTEPCTIPAQQPQFTYSFIETSSPPPGPSGPTGPSCVTRSVNDLWIWDLNVNRAPSLEPQASTTRWIPIGSRNKTFSIKFPPANKFKEIYGTAQNPASFTIGFVPRAGRIIPDGIIFLSECEGDFNTPLPGCTKTQCSGTIFNGFGTMTVVTTADTTVQPFAPKYLGNKEFYFNFKFTGPEENNLGAYVDVNLVSALGGGIGAGGSIGGDGTGGGGGGSNPQYSPSNFTPVGEIINIPVPTVPPGVEAYLYYSSFLPQSWGISAQDTYNREMSTGLSAIWAAYWNALPPSTQSFARPPATSSSDPIWVYGASQLAESWIIFAGKNPFV